MAVLGKGSLFFWHDLNEGFESDYEAWHSQEHMPERLRLPGFLRARRYRNTGLGPKWVIWYEVSDTPILTGAEYLARLNDPTPWTRWIIAECRHTSRTACAVTASFGRGVGAFLLTLRMAPAEGRIGDLKKWLTDLVLPGLVSRPGLSGAHLLVGDPERSRIETEERKLMSDPGEIAEWVVLVEAYDDVALRAAALSLFAPGEPEKHGAAPGFEKAIHILRHTLSREDCGG